MGTRKRMPAPKQPTPAEAPELVHIHLRLRVDDVEQARRCGLVLGTPYQHVIRGWVADGALASIAASNAKATTK